MTGAAFVHDGKIIAEHVRWHDRRWKENIIDTIHTGNFGLRIDGMQGIDMIAKRLGEGKPGLTADLNDVLVF